MEEQNTRLSACTVAVLREGLIGCYIVRVMPLDAPPFLALHPFRLSKKDGEKWRQGAWFRAGAELRTLSSLIDRARLLDDAECEAFLTKKAKSVYSLLDRELTPEKLQNEIGRVSVGRILVIISKAKTGGPYCYLRRSKEERVLYSTTLPFSELADVSEVLSLAEDFLAEQKASAKH